MANCFIVKLKGASSNSDLPVYVNEVSKQLIKATTSNQYIDVSSYMDEIGFNNIEIVIDFCIPSNSPYIEDGDIRVFETRANQLVVAINGNHIKVKAATTSLFEQEVTLDTIHSLKLNTSSQTITLDGVESSYSFSHTHTDINTASIFTSGSNGSQRPGSVFIGETKFKKVSTDTVYLDAVPVIKDGISYFKNVLEENDYLSANSGSLEAFNLS